MLGHCTDCTRRASMKSESKSESVCYPILCRSSVESCAAKFGVVNLKGEEENSTGHIELCFPS